MHGREHVVNADADAVSVYCVLLCTYRRTYGRGG